MNPADLLPRSFHPRTFDPQRTIAVLWATTCCGMGMSGPTRAQSISSILRLMIVLASFGSMAACWAEHEMVRERLPQEWRDNAELTDVFFLNSKQAWAVGAQGVIIRSTDGGVSWKEIAQLPAFRHDQMSLGEKIRNLQSGRRTNTTGLTSDGERNRLLRCRFESVFFINEKIGWVAGGYSVPYLDRTRAVVMKTSDGGISWSSVSGMMIPRLRKIHFQSVNRGWAIGDSGNLFGAGLYFSDDGGQSWRSDTAQQQSSWLTAANSKSGNTTIDTFGRLGQIAHGKASLSVTIDLNQPTNFQDLLMLDAEHGIAVGQQGTIMRTKNGGSTWQPLALGSAAPAIKQLDLRTAALAGQRLWFAGSPGTCLVSVDLTTGQTDVVRTPLATRINRIHFADDQLGLAVGDRGAVLRTQDGGFSWKQTRQQPQSTALMFVASQATQLPLELLAQYSVEENRICSAVILQDALEPYEAGRQAVERLGAVSSCRLLLEHPLTSVSKPMQRHRDNPADRQQLLEALVKQIRIERPAVVVSSATDSRQVLASSNRQTIPSIETVEFVRQAIRMAADAKAFPGHQDAGLKPHAVRRLVTRDPLGPVSVNPEKLLARSGQLIVDASALSRALLGKRVTIESGARYQVEHLTNLRRMKGMDLVSGLNMPIPTRDGRTSYRANLTDIKNATERSKQRAELLQFEIHGSEDIQVWRGKLERIAIPLEPEIASHWLMQLAEGYQAAGKLELAAQTVQVLATRWSESPYSLAGLVWLAEYYASEEMGQIEFRNRIAKGRLDLAGRPTQASQIANQYSAAPTRSVVNGVAQLEWKTVQTQSAASLQQGPGKVAQASFTDPDEIQLLPRVQPKVLEQRLLVAARFMAAASQRDPDLAESPWYQWMESQISRRMKGPESTTESRLTRLTSRGSNRLGQTLGQQRLAAGIALGAQRELELLDPNGIGSAESQPAEQPKRNNLARQSMKIDLTTLPDSMNLIPWSQRTVEAPQLDGNLHDACWKSADATDTGVEAANRVPIRNQVLFSHDEAFLYVAIRCRKLDGVSYAWKPSPRPRDADLDRRDRVAIEIDVDRDYRTRFRFEIDHRGWVNESCSGMQDWNPAWYVSQSETPNTWTIEAAIPLEEIVARQIASEDVWVVKATRLTGSRQPDNVSPFQVRPIDVDQFQLLKFSSPNSSSNPSRALEPKRGLTASQTL